MVVGEAQIVAQLKAAYQQACEGGCTSVVFNRLFRHALEVGKRVRTETAIGERPVSVSSAAVELALQVFGRFRDHTVLIVGAGETSELTATHLKAHGIERDPGDQPHVRRPPRSWPAGWAAAPCPSRSSKGTWPAADIVISSTSAPHYVVTRERVERALKHRRQRPIFFIDIAVPRDLDPEINRVRNAYLYDIDDLQHVVEQNRHEREKEAEHAERIVGEELRSVNDWLRSLEVVPTIATLREAVEQIRQGELERLGNKLSDFSDEQRAQVEMLTNSHRQQDPAHADRAHEGGRRAATSATCTSTPCAPCSTSTATARRGARGTAAAARPREPRCRGRRAARSEATRACDRRERRPREAASLRIGSRGSRLALDPERVGARPAAGAAPRPARSRSRSSRPRATSCSTRRSPRSATRACSPRSSRRPCSTAAPTCRCTRPRTCPRRCPTASPSSPSRAREDVRDVFVRAARGSGGGPRATWPYAARPEELPARARVGSSSLRRRSQLLALRPDLRARRHPRQRADAPAQGRGAGHGRHHPGGGRPRPPAGRAELAAFAFSFDEMLPAVGQGVAGHRGARRRRARRRAGRAAGARAPAPRPCAPSAP